MLSLYWRRLVAALVIAFVGLWIGRHVYGLQSSIFDKKGDIKKILLEHSSQDEVLEAVGKMIDGAFNPIATNDERADLLFRISAICFCAAILLLALVGGRQLWL